MDSQRRAGVHHRVTGSADTELQMIVFTPLYVWEAGLPVLLTHLLTSGGSPTRLLLDRVRSCMSRQMRRIEVPFPACGTKVRLLPCVGSSDVDRQVAAEAEIFPARFADKRPLAGVDSHVDVHFGHFDEAFPAELAKVRPLAGVDSGVDVEPGHFDEALPADLTEVRLLSSVRSGVDFEFGHVDESLPAGLAQVRPLARVVPPDVDP